MLPDWISVKDRLPPAQKILGHLAAAVQARRECKAAYDKWYDAGKAQRLHTVHEEVVLRTNLGHAERNVLDAAEALVDLYYK
jgi:hypothetical protein